jgi:hypothetical protein
MKCYNPKICIPQVNYQSDNVRFQISPAPDQCVLNRPISSVLVLLCTLMYILDSSSTGRNVFNVF